MSPSSSKTTQPSKGRKRPVKPKGGKIPKSAGAPKELAPSFATGGGGTHFETHVQAAFVTLMLTGGYAPGLRPWPIVEVKLQGKIEGYETDDLVVTIQRPGANERRRLLGQIKFSCDLTARSAVFADVLRAHWLDYQSGTFSRGADALALTTGPMKDIDITNVHWLLRQSRATDTAETFIRRVETAKFRPPHAPGKLDAFRYHLTRANGGVAITDQVLWDFLRHFHLLSYDLGGEFGVVLPLLHSHMAQFRLEAHLYWGRLVAYVGAMNPDAGVITRDRVPEEIREAFAMPQPTVIPTAYTSRLSLSATETEQLPVELAALLLIGGIDDTNEHDLDAAAEVLGVSKADLVTRMRTALRSGQRSLVYAKGTWRVLDRKNAVASNADQLFPDHIERFVTVASNVLSEDELVRSSDINLLGHTEAPSGFTYSSTFRQGLAEGLAILGNFTDQFVRLRDDMAESGADRAVKAILHGAPWERWAALTTLLPALAEASPPAFLRAAERARRDEGTLTQILMRGKVDLFETEYLSGLLWAFEAIAWKPEYFFPACYSLAALADLDDITARTGRPASSLATILLPWRPQTEAGPSARIRILHSMSEEYPRVVFPLLLALLPSRGQISSGTQRPLWRATPLSADAISVSPDEYHDQVDELAKLAITLAQDNPERLLQLVQYTSGLAPETIERLLDTVHDLAVWVADDDLRLRLWTGLNKELAKHRRFATEAWALDPDALAKLEQIASDFAPTDPMVSLRPLFGNDDLTLFDQDESDYDRKRDKLAKRRVDALEQILRGGVDKVLEFAQHVAAPHRVGDALAALAGPDIDAALLPELVTSTVRSLRAMVGSYALRRYDIEGDKWLESLNLQLWLPDQVGAFLAFLPLKLSLWRYAVMHSKKAREIYWSEVAISPFTAESEVNSAVLFLIRYGRAADAVELLDLQRYQTRKPDPQLCVEALQACLVEAHDRIDENHMLDLLRYVQEAGDVDEASLEQVEFALLPLFFLPGSTRPITLERRLSHDPEFFCDMVRTVYRPDHEASTSDTPEPVDEQKRKRAEHAWRLLEQWREFPGMSDGGVFDAREFKAWFDAVRLSATASGHVDAAMSHVGQVIAHFPKNTDQFWLPAILARALDERDAVSMRDGFRTGLFNARGPHWVNPSGQDEFVLSDTYAAQAVEADQAGYNRLAELFRDIAKYHKRAGKSIKEEYQQRLGTSEG